MRALVVGYGSIGRRHARLLAELGCRTAVVSARDVDFPWVHRSLGEALADSPVDYLVIANPTASHHALLAEAAALGYRGRVLVEKPLFEAPRALPDAAFAFAGVAYNLRFHPAIRRLREILDGQPLLTLQVYAGQYLPTWRPETDYRQAYSAREAAGGGALLDLSHELDYLQWLAGPCNAVAALGGHLSPLEIDSDDVHALLCRTVRCPVATVHVNYLERPARRFIIANTAESTVAVDLIAGTVSVDSRVESHGCDRDHTYRSMHAAVLEGRHADVCTLEEGMQTVRLADAAKRAARSARWITP